MMCTHAVEYQWIGTEVRRSHREVVMSVVGAYGHEATRRPAHSAASLTFSDPRPTTCHVSCTALARLLLAGCQTIRSEVREGCGSARISKTPFAERL